MVWDNSELFYVHEALKCLTNTCVEFYSWIESYLFYLTPAFFLRCPLTFRSADFLHSLFLVASDLVTSLKFSYSLQQVVIILLLYYLSLCSLLKHLRIEYVFCYKLILGIHIFPMIHIEVIIYDFYFRIVKRT